MRRAFSLTTLALLFLFGCGLVPSRRPANVLLITLDTARLDHLSAYGYERRTTPFLKQLAARAVRFTNAVTPMPTTDPAHMTLLTGRRPYRTGVEENGIELPEEETTLAELLRAQGYSTAAFTSVRHLGTRGYAQGFDIYVAPVDEHQVKGNVTLERALAWLDGGPAEPFFLWVHLFDPHMDYNAPAPFKQMFGDDPAARYDGEIAFADDCLGKLLARVEDRGFSSRTAVIVATDHGENLTEWASAPGKEDYRFSHGHSVTEREIRVGLVVLLPGLRRGGSTVDAPAELADVFPTLLDYLHIPPPEAVIDGKSLLPLLQGEKDAVPPRAGTFSYTNWNRAPWLCARNGRYKVIRDTRDGSEVFYDLATDPAEANPIRAENAPPEARSLLVELARWAEEKDRIVESRRAARYTTDPRILESLKALGYVLPEAPPTPP